MGRVLQPVRKTALIEASVCVFVGLQEEEGGGVYRAQQGEMKTILKKMKKGNQKNTKLGYGALSVKCNV